MKNLFIFRLAGCIVLSLSIFGESRLYAFEERIKALEEAIASSQPAITYDIGVFSKYIWRGWNLFDDPVYQANIDITQGGVSAGIWGNYALGDLDRLSELDFTIDFADSVGIVGMNIGYVKYTFPNVAAGAGRESAEFYTGLSVDCLASPALTIYYDFDQGDGTYIETSVSHGFEIKELGIEPTVTLGYNDHQWRTGASSFTNLDPGVSISYNRGKCIFTANWVYSFGLDNDFGFKENHGFAGFNISVGF